MLSCSMGGGFCGELSIVAGLIGIQMVYGSYMVFLNRVLARGFSPMFLVVTASIVSGVFLVPLAVFWERKKWPKRLRAVTIVQFVLIALGGSTVFQVLMAFGIKYTSAAVATAMPNLAPGFIFLIAACLRHEKLDVGCKYSRAKIMGTLMCLCGVFAMSFLEDPTTSPSVSLTLQDTPARRRWLLGCSYQFIAVIALSCSTILQAVAMREFPAPISLCVITSVLGSIFTAAVEIIVEGRLGVGSSNFSLKDIILIVLTGSMVLFAGVSFQTWCIQRKGPVFVSMFNPIQTVCSALLSALIFGQAINLKSMAGMFLMFSGLYIVLWAKRKEESKLVNGDDGSLSSANLDVEKPLLS